MIKNFSIFKNDKKQEHHPDYKLSAKITKGNVDEYKDIGAGYIKDGAKGKYISVSLSKTREWEGKTISGYVIVDEEYAKKAFQVYEDYLIKGKLPDYPTPTEVGIDTSKTLVPDPAFDVKPEDLDVNPDDIPF